MDNFGFKRQSNKIRICGDLVDHPTFLFYSPNYDLNYYLFHVNIATPNAHPNLIPVVVSETQKALVESKNIGDNVTVYGSLASERFNEDKYSTFVEYEKIFNNTLYNPFGSLCIIRGILKSPLMPVTLRNGKLVNTLILSYDKYRLPVKVSISQNTSQNYDTIDYGDSVACRTTLYSSSSQYLAVHANAKIIVPQNQLEENPRLKERFNDLDASNYALCQMLKR